MSRSRNQCFTLNNYTSEEVSVLEELDVKYIVFGYEVGENGTPHLQGYLEFENARALGGVKKIVGDRAHLEQRRGTAKQAVDYCKKDGEFFEKGELSSQGNRTDIDAVKEDILNGAKEEDVIINNFQLYCRYKNGFDKLMDMQNCKKKRTTMTKGIQLYGPTGVGKSHKAFELAGDDVYVQTDDNGQQDGYTGQGTVIINDFRGAIKYNEMLLLVDKQPHSVKRRGRQPMPFTSHTVIVTSSLDIDGVYYNLSVNDSTNQLKRRFEVTKLGDTEVHPGNTSTGWQHESDSVFDEPNNV